MLSVAVKLDRGSFALDVSFEAESLVTGVFGPSGAGKSTLINLIAGLERPAEGRIQLNGDVLFDDRASVDVPVQRRRIGVVFQEHRLFPHLDVEGNLRYGWRLRPPAERRFEVATIVDLLELGPLLNQRVVNLSGGERQRVALGRALLSSPRLLLLDEPLASLDRRLKFQILPFLERVRDAAAIPMVYVSHDLAELLRLTDRLLVVEKGRSMGSGPAQELVHAEILDESGFTNVLRTRLVEHREADGVSVLAIGDSDRTLVASPAAASPGSTVVLSIRPSDVALAAGEVPAVSIRNQLQATVTRRSDHERFTLVELDIGAPLIALISRRSATQMDIRAGRSIVCHIKSHAIEYLSGSRASSV
jgi:molybdate transport system ATP-binding protein